LKEISDPPPVLYIKGNLNLSKENKCIAVVGSRKITSYGRQVNEILVDDLVASSFTIVSGLARGVDSIAAKAVLENKGKTIAVLGSGVCNSYPPEKMFP
jgi:DNA processing protein